MHKKNTLFLFSLAALLLFTGCGKKEPITKTAFYFDTVIQITLYDDSREASIDDCFQMAASYEKLLSRTVPGSEIDKINHSGGQAVAVSDDTMGLLKKGISYYELSGGAFDITLGGLSDLWDIGGNPGNVPAPDEIASALSHVGADGIQLLGSQVTLKDPQASVDLGGIAKGYIADKMKEALNGQGVTEGIINLGGNVLTLGPKSDGSPYTIGIQKPFSQEGSPLLSVEITDGTVVSSGVYERYFQVGDTIYHHILDPKSGYPYDNGLYSVSILGSSSADADALSTACFGLGLTEGLALIETLPDTEAVFITDTYEVVVSSGMGEKIPYTVYE